MQTPVESRSPDEAQPGLQVAMRQLEALWWEQRGSAVAVHAATGTVLLDEDALYRIEIHQGNPEAIAEILHDLRRSSVKARKRPRSTKYENRGKTSY